MPNQPYQLNDDDDDVIAEDDDNNDDELRLPVTVKMNFFLSSLGNRPHPSGGKPLFDDTDPRLQFIVTEVDPRIHFALVCGAKVPSNFSLFKHVVYHSI